MHPAAACGHEASSMHIWHAHGHAVSSGLRQVGDARGEQGSPQDQEAACSFFQVIIIRVLRLCIAATDLQRPQQPRDLLLQCMWPDAGIPLLCWGLLWGHAFRGVS